MRQCTVCHEPVPPGMPVCPRDGGAAEDPDEGAERTIGSMIGEYRVKGLIGEGGMGQVYEGFQPVIGKRVAIKLLRRELAAEKGEAHRLLSEARAVNAIGHRGIIDIFSFGALPDGRQYFVMEYLSGCSLSAHLKQHGALPLGDVLRILDEVLAALGAAHAAGVIHRDLKPSNIFLVRQPDGSSFVKLLDFGLAKQAPAPRGETPQTRVSRVMGTPEFMAPEQARGQPVGPRTDLYAVGVIAFELLTGQRLFTADTAFEVVNMHLNKAPQPPSSRVSGVPAELDDLVLRLLAKSAADRPAGAAEVRDEIKALRRALRLEATQFIVAPSSMTQLVPEPVGDERPSEVRAARRAETRDAASFGALPPSDTIASPPNALDSDDLRVTRTASTSESNTQLVDHPVSRPTSRGRWLLPVSAIGAALVAAAVVVLSVERRPRAEPSAASPPPAPSEPVAAPTPNVTATNEAPLAETPKLEPARLDQPPVVTPAPDRPKPRPDALAVRYKRIASAWGRARSGKSAEDRRLFDLMLEEVGKQLASGPRAETNASLDAFVRGALDGREP